MLRIGSLTVTSFTIRTSKISRNVSAEGPWLMIRSQSSTRPQFRAHVNASKVSIKYSWQKKRNASKSNWVITFNASNYTMWGLIARAVRGLAPWRAGICSGPSSVKVRCRGSRANSLANTVRTWPGRKMSRTLSTGGIDWWGRDQVSLKSDLI